jgi:hypothetical protein
VLTVVQRSAKASEARNSRTWRSIKPLIAADNGPTRRSSRGRSLMTPANTSLRIASMSTCSWIAPVTFVAMASCTSGELTSGATVST